MATTAWLSRSTTLPRKAISEKATMVVIRAPLSRGDIEFKLVTIHSNNILPRTGPIFSPLQAAAYHIHGSKELGSSISVHSVAEDVSGIYEGNTGPLGGS